MPWSLLQSSPGKILTDLMQSFAGGKSRDVSAKIRFLGYLCISFVCAFLILLSVVDSPISYCKWTERVVWLDYQAKGSLCFAVYVQWCGNEANPWSIDRIPGTHRLADPISTALLWRWRYSYDPHFKEGNQAQSCRLTCPKSHNL